MQQHRHVPFIYSNPFHYLLFSFLNCCSATSISFPRRSNPMRRPIPGTRTRIRKRRSSAGSSDGGWPRAMSAMSAPTRSVSPATSGFGPSRTWPSSASPELWTRCSDSGSPRGPRFSAGLSRRDSARANVCEPVCWSGKLPAVSDRSSFYRRPSSSRHYPVKKKTPLPMPHAEGRKNANARLHSWTSAQQEMVRTVVVTVALGSGETICVKVGIAHSVVRSIRSSRKKTPGSLYECPRGCVFWKREAVLGIALPHSAPLQESALCALRVCLTLQRGETITGRSNKMVHARPCTCGHLRL